ncbi:MAG: PHP domain-containing protein [Candidatus Hadarchaeota archaeon]
MEKYADLHVHTSASDSIYTADAVLRVAKEAGLAAVGICDHDSIDGIRAALELEEKYGVEVVPGIELSTEVAEHEVHILGYFYEWEDMKFQALLRTIQQVRIWRAEVMVKKLQQLGFEMEFKEVLDQAAGGSVGRPHIAKVMLTHGYVKTMDEVFEKYLRYGGPAWVGKYEISPEEAITQIKKLRGVPVLAHPKYSPYNDGDLSGLVKTGLMGIEVYHSRHSPQESEKYLQMAREHDLIITGGSDSHGAEDPVGSVKVPYESVEKMKNARRKLLFGE